jgi:hypothetical protein
MENELNLAREMAKRRIEQAEYRKLQSNNMCDYCLGQNDEKVCDSENKNNVACGYFQGIKVLIEN